MDNISSHPKKVRERVLERLPILVQAKKQIAPTPDPESKKLSNRSFQKILFSLFGVGSEYFLVCHVVSPSVAFYWNLEDRKTLNAVIGEDALYYGFIFVGGEVLYSSFFCIFEKIQKRPF